MVLFVGNEETGYFVSDVLPNVKYTGFRPDITKIADGLLQDPLIHRDRSFLMAPKEADKIKDVKPSAINVCMISDCGV